MHRHSERERERESSQVTRKKTTALRRKNIIDLSFEKLSSDRSIDKGSRNSWFRISDTAFQVSRFKILARIHHFAWRRLCRCPFLVNEGWSKDHPWITPSPSSFANVEQWIASINPPTKWREENFSLRCTCASPCREFCQVAAHTHAPKFRYACENLLERERERERGTLEISSHADRFTALATSRRSSTTAPFDSSFFPFFSFFSFLPFLWVLSLERMERLRGFFFFLFWSWVFREDSWGS